MGNLLALSRFCLPFSLCFFCGSGAIAELEWDKVRSEHGVSRLTSHVSGCFKFAYSGTRVINIVEVVSSCGCLKGFVEKQKIGPGEDGKVEYRFKVKDCFGRCEKKLLVITDEEEAPEHLLSVIVNVRSLLSKTGKF
jgi:hypothetical protein